LAPKKISRASPYRSDFAKLYHGQGMDQGWAEGRAEGKVQGRAKAVLIVMAARGLTISPRVKARVKRCSDLNQLDEWLGRAATAQVAEQVFAPPDQSNESDD
jgi:hypothetical protein